MASTASPPNRFLPQSRKAIVFNVRKTETGWDIVATTPKRVSPEERRTVIGWFQKYHSTLRHMHPFWLTRFYSTGQGYILEVRPTKSPREMLKEGQNLKEIWTGEIANRA